MRLSKNNHLTSYIQSNKHLQSNPSELGKVVDKIGTRVEVIRTDGEVFKGILTTCYLKLPMFDFGTVTVDRFPIRDYQVHKITIL